MRSKADETLVIVEIWLPSSGSHNKKPFSGSHFRKQNIFFLESGGLSGKVRATKV